MHKIVWVLFLCLSLSISLGSCSPPQNQIIAQVEDGKILFHIRTPGMFFDNIFGWDDEEHDIVTLYLVGNRKLFWSFTMPKGLYAPYPIIYGQKIPSSDVIMEPKKLEKNKVYEVFIDERFNQNFDKNAINLDNHSFSAQGLFWINADGTVINLKPD